MIRSASALLAFCTCVGVTAVGCASGDGAAAPTAPLPGDPAFVRDPALDVTVESAAGGTTSHNQGQSCMQCHQEHGPGRGRFTVAGTLHDATGKPTSGGAVTLSASPSGPAVATLSVDALGNYFTTKDVGLDAKSLFVAVEGAGGVDKNAMPFPTLSGACNHCHTGSARVALKP